jgi:hypothetical protein
MRKNAGLKISDRIRLTYGGDDLGSVMQAWGHYIAEETLAESVQIGERPEGGYAEDHDINGRKVMLAVESTD